MAVLQELQDQLNCSICLDTYTNPKLLQCNHVYCQQCLTRIVFRDQQGQLALTCPSCRQVMDVPANGVAGLQAAFRVNKLLEIVKEHKTATVSVKSEPSTAVVCPGHGGKEVELYCETCGEAICWKCIKKGEKHHSHNYEELHEAFERYKVKILSLLEPLKKNLTSIENAVMELDEHRSKITDQQATIEADIYDTFTRLHQTLDARKDKLISHLHQLTQAKLKSLAVQKDQIQNIQAQLSGCLLLMKKNLETEHQAEALLMKSATFLHVKELTTTLQTDMLQPNAEADMIFSVLSDLSAECQKYGQIHSAGSPDPTKCSATGKGLDSAVVGDRASILLQIVNYLSQPCKIPVTSISCELVSEITCTVVSGSVEIRGENEFVLYEISYEPIIKGKHRLRINVNGQNIKESPFCVSVNAQEESHGTPILTTGGLRQPEGVAVNKKGDVLVAETAGHCVSVFSPSGKRLRAFDTHSGSHHKALQHPHGVAVTDQEDVLVTERDGDRVWKFSPQGEVLAVVGTRGNGPLQFSFPRGITFNASNGKVYVTDNGNNRIQILNPDFSYFGAFGKKGSGKGQFDSPEHIACDRAGNLYVADYNNHRIQVFTAEGKLLRVIDTGRGKPCGVGVASGGRVYITDMNNHQVCVYSAEGQFLASFGSQGEEPGEFHFPTGLAVDGCGVVYVCDFCNNRVQDF